jgi:hypothetical protein
VSVTQSPQRASQSEAADEWFQPPVARETGQKTTDFGTISINWNWSKCMLLQVSDSPASDAG